MLESVGEDVLFDICELTAVFFFQAGWEGHRRPTNATPTVSMPTSLDDVGLVQ
jgi:hypothetical protein